ncbi:hypothetical protein V6Z12_D10G152500 [Gossypium hirsutum]
MSILSLEHLRGSVRLILKGGNLPMKIFRKIKSIFLRIST